MNSLTLNLQTSKPARCPLCMHDLVTGAVCTVDSVVVCATCASSASPEHLLMATKAVLAGLSCNFISTSHGLYLYTPKQNAPRSMSLHLRLSQQQHRDDWLPCQDA